VAGLLCVAVLLSVLFWTWRHLRLERAAEAVARYEKERLAEQVEAEGRRHSHAPPGQPAPAEQPKEQRPVLLYIHVAGAVRRPGVYRLPEGARVFEAIEEAGGALESGHTDRINMAEQLADGQQIYVPARGEEPPPAPGSQAGGPGGGQAAPVGRININRASAAELERIPRIGPSLASAIIAYRKENGAFRSVDDLVRVPGIGNATLERIRPYVTV
jgi:competence protein ComEA